MKSLIYPIDHQQLMPYLVIEDTEGFIQFMKTVFHAKEKIKYKNEDGIIAHAELSIGNSVFMFSGDITQLTPCVCGLFVYVADSDATYAKAIKLGAIGILEIKNNPFGRSGGFKDPFGNTWWIKTYRVSE